MGPSVEGASREALITVRKTGDPTTRSKLRVYTLDGSAKAGRGYQPVTEVNIIFFDYLNLMTNHKASFGLHPQADIASSHDSITTAFFSYLQILEFSGNKSIHLVPIKILFDAQRKIRRAFTVHLSSDITGESGLGLKKVIVYIEQPSTNPAVTFPLSPKVVSLRDYDDVSGAGSEIIMGYPLICVTVSDPNLGNHCLRDIQTRKTVFVHMSRHREDS